MSFGAEYRTEHAVQRRNVDAVFRLSADTRSHQFSDLHFPGRVRDKTRVLPETHQPLLLRQLRKQHQVRAGTAADVEDARAAVRDVVTDLFYKAAIMRRLPMYHQCDSSTA